MGSQKIKELEDSDERPEALENALCILLLALHVDILQDILQEKIIDPCSFIQIDFMSLDQYIRWINGLKMKWDGELNADNLRRI